MASAEVIKKLLLKYFKEAPKQIVIDHLETMFNALSSAQKQALIDAAKAYLLPKAQSALEIASESHDAVHIEAAIVIDGVDTTLVEAETLLDEVESL